MKASTIARLFTAGAVAVSLKRQPPALFASSSGWTSAMKKTRWMLFEGLARVTNALPTRSNSSTVHRRAGGSGTGGSASAQLPGIGGSGIGGTGYHYVRACPKMA